MQDPIKVIWKYKNNNKRICYGIYIFVGNITSSIDKILNKIKDMNLYDTLTLLDDSEIEKMVKRYGDHWYDKFFNIKHIASTFNQVRNTPSLRKELKKKYGDEWINSHIEVHSMVNKKILYTFEGSILDENSRKNANKKKYGKESYDSADLLNFKINPRVNVNSSQENVNRKSRSSEGEVVQTDEETVENQVGGKGDTDDETVGDDLAEYDDGIGDDEEINNNEIDEEEFDEGLAPTQVTGSEELDLDEIEKIYQEVETDIDENSSKVSGMIQKALGDDSFFEKSTEQMIDFDQSKDSSVNDENLKDVYFKFYVKNQYIFKDDTIKNIKNKICCAIKNNPKYGEFTFLPPSRQYLWSEYVFQNEFEYVMLGQRWMKRNEVLQVDVIPSQHLRYYEDLNGKLKSLKDNLRKYGNKIRREDEENNILYDYDDYVTNNEIFLLDVYNELGSDYQYDIEKTKNLQEIYLKIYFPKIKSSEIKHIVDYVNGFKGKKSSSNAEESYMQNVHTTISNDLALENEIVNVVEEVKMKNKYTHLFKENYITQSVIHVNLRLENQKETTFEQLNRVDLYRIFNEFVVDENYPFVQYQTADSSVVKFHKENVNVLAESKESLEMLHKWFENNPFGVSFKVKISDRQGLKYMSIGISENGRIEYKTQWKEDDMATIDDIFKTYGFVRNLVEKINGNSSKQKFIVPEDIEFKYAFINTIQKFILPENFIINHNNLSNFSRFFFPYVSLVIDPRKRIAKKKSVEESSKFGTYLRFKRVSKYENQSRLEQRIIYFMRNYEITDNTLASEISRQFNITEEYAAEEIIKIRQKFPNMRKSRKILKKLDVIPKYKPPGIGIDIQGKQRDKYKIRISGARDKGQLDRMLDFLNILLFLYTETYLYKKEDRQHLKERLKNLNNIAKRRNKVIEIVNYSKEAKSVKQMAQLDKRRLGYKPTKSSNQWTRMCQNSGKEKRRRPQQYTDIGDLMKKGYVYNKGTDMYEKTITLKNKQGKKEEIILRAVKLLDESGEAGSADNYIYYACDPDENDEHMYIGFLTRSNNPYGECMPCCFIINPATAKNKAKRDFFNKCLGNQTNNEKNTESKSSGDLLYILIHTNKLQEGRLCFLQPYLELYFNTMLKKEKKFKHHSLSYTPTGYFFKYGSHQSELPFLNAVSSAVDISVEEIRSRISKVLKKDKTLKLFTSLNEGDIRTQFTNVDKYIKFIETSTYVDFDTIVDILTIPGVLFEDGLNIIIFKKKTTVVEQTLEKEKIKEDFIVICKSFENKINISHPSRPTIFIIKEDENYYPIVMVIKNDETSKSVELVKNFTYSNKKDNIVKHFEDFYINSDSNIFTKNIMNKNVMLSAKETASYLQTYDQKYHPMSQIIDIRNKCKYLILKNGCTIPISPSGSLFDVAIETNVNSFIQPMPKALDCLTELYKLSDKKLPLKPVGVYYDAQDNLNINVTGIMTVTKNIVPIVPVSIKITELEKLGLVYEKKPLDETIDNELIKGRNNIHIDNRLTSVKKSLYDLEGYELFRLELSTFIASNLKLKTALSEIISNKESNLTKVNMIKAILFKLIDDSLYKAFITSLKEYTRIDTTEINQEKFIEINDIVPDIHKYEIENERSVCPIQTKTICSKKIHCSYNKGKCLMTLPKTNIIQYVIKIAQELTQGDVRCFEIMQIGNYYVSDIVDRNKFTERDSQKIIRSSTANLSTVLGDIFGKDNVPQIGKRPQSRFESNDDILNSQHLPLEKEKVIIQEIIPNNLTLFRTFANGYYWITNQVADYTQRNLGYYSKYQTDLANYFKGSVVEWLSNSQNVSQLAKDLKEFKINSPETLNITIGKNVDKFTDCMIELYVLEKVIARKIPIIVSDIDDNIIFVVDKVIIKKSNDTKHYSNNRKNCINIQFTQFQRISSTNNEALIPDILSVIYHK